MTQGRRDPVTVFGFIAAKKTEHCVKTMCRVLGVSRLGYHAWAKRKPSARALKDARLTERIAEFHRLSRKVGSVRVYTELRLATASASRASASSE